MQSKIKIKVILKPGIMMDTWNSTAQGARVENQEFMASPS